MKSAGLYFHLFGTMAAVAAVFLRFSMGSQLILIIGGVSAFLLIASGYFMLSGLKFGVWLGMLLSALIFGFFSYTLALQYFPLNLFSVFPAGIMEFLSLLGLLFCVAAKKDS